MTDKTINDAVTMRPGGGAVLGRIDKYELVSELGEGGFGAVYLAKDTLAKTDVAIKGLPPEVKHNKSELEGIRENFALVKRLRHPNIVAVTDLHQASAVSYASKEVEAKLRVFPQDTMVVMDYAPGVTLAKWRRQFPDGKVPIDIAVAVVRQIASALDYAHGQKVLHRDVKPANIIVETSADGNRTARILDFGLAAEIRSSMGRLSREIRDTSGTRPYMAPEQWLGHRQGPATDQYALAVIFYELVGGEVPFASVFDCGDPAVMRLAVTTDEPDVPSSHPKEVRNALAKALAKKPEERFASCVEFVDALEGKVKVSRRGAGTRSGGSGIWKTLGVLVLLAALGAGGYYGWTKYNEGVKARKAEEVRVRQEVYELKGKASQSREKNAKEEWHDWPHFALKAKELEGAFRAGDSAFEKDDYEVAKMQFLKVRDTWYWLSSNKVERAKADGARRRADASRLAAESAQAPDLAAEAYSTASNSLMRAGQAFAAGEFSAAVEEAGAAEKAYGRAAELAKAEAARRAAEKKKANSEAALAAFRAMPPRYEEGFRLAQTADQDNSDIQFYIGVCYDFGYGVAKDDVEAVKWYRKAAEQGDCVAQYNLGNMCKIGRGVAKDEAESVKWYRKAAEQGYADAQNNLGVMYENGQGVVMDEAEAVKWYRKAAEQGNAKGQREMGWRHQTGSGVVKDLAMAVEWYRKAANQGYSTAQFDMGIMYDNGWGVAKDEAEAVKWYRKAAEQGYVNAQYNLGVSYANGQGVTKDEAEAVKWYRKAAEQGYAAAQNNLGVMYENGQGVVKDEAEAVKWYRKAAEQGHAKGQREMGWRYQTGNGVVKDLAMAVEWYRKAANQGYSTAQFDMGVMYANGWGVAKDESEAVKWYRKAAEQGYAAAQNNLGVMYENGQGVVKDEAEAVKWYRKAAENGNVNGQYNLGDMYENGKGIAMNIAEAKKWYKKASDNGHESAKKRLADLSDDIDITTVDAATRYKEGLEMVGIDVEGKFRYGPTIRVSPSDNLPDILENCKDKTTIILSPGEYKGNGSVFMYSKSVRICGDGNGVVLTKLSPTLDGKGDGNCLLVLENLTVVDGDNDYGVWVNSKAVGVVDRCIFKNCGVRVNDSGGSCRMVVARTRIEGNYYWGIDFCSGTRGYVSDTMISGGEDYAIIAFENSRFAVRNSLLKLAKENNKTGIRAPYDNVRFCVEDTTIKGFRYGINVGKNVRCSVLRCKFKDMLYCGIENDGVIETYRNSLTGTGKMFSGSGTANESSKDLSVNRNMLR